MATFEQSINLDARKMMQDVTMTINLTHMRELRFRVAVVIFLLELIEWIAPFEVEMSNVES